MTEYHVTMAGYEREFALSVAKRRHESATATGRKSSHGANPSNDIKIHQIGAGGELIFAKFIGRYWGGSVDTYKSEPDIGPNIHVRTRTKRNYELYLRDDDVFSGIWGLVILHCGEWYVRGYVFGDEVKEIGRYTDFGNGRDSVWAIDNVLLRDAKELAVRPCPLGRAGRVFSKERDERQERD